MLSAGRSNRVVLIVDGAIGLLLVGLLAFTVLTPLGTVDAWSESVAVELGAGIAVCLAVRLVLRGHREGLPKTAALVPLTLFVALAAIQVVPLPAALVRFVSPETMDMRSQLLGDLPGGPARLRWATLSFYPHATRHDLRIVLLACVAFLAALVVVRTPGRIKALLAAVAALGAFEAGLALMQYASTTGGGIYWSHQTDTRHGTFINHSDFAQHVNLCVGAALGLLLAVIATPRGTRPSGGIRPLRRVRQAHRRQAQGRQAHGWAGRAGRWVGLGSLALAIVAGLVALLRSQSRGGIVAACAGGAFVLLALVTRRQSKRLASVVVLLGSLVVAASLAVGIDRAFERAHTLGRPEEYASRLSTVADIVRIGQRFPLLGTGLGTHEWFYPRFQTLPSVGRLTHAENEYAQALEETGLPGLGCVMAFVIIVWRGWARSVGGGAKAPVCLAAAGLGYGLLAVQVHSFSDFGQHLPSIGCLSAVTCAVLLNLGALAEGGSEDRAAAEGRAGGGWSEWGRPLAVAAVLAAAGAWTAQGAIQAARAEAEWNKAWALGQYLEERGGIGSARQFDNLLRLARAAVGFAPDDVYYQMWLNVWRWDAAVAATAAPKPPVDDAPRPKRGEVVVEDVPPPPDSGPPVAATPEPAQARPIVAALDEARSLCPTFGPLYAFLGQIELEPLGRPIGGMHLRTALLLAPHDPVALFQSGSLAARQGLWLEAQRIFRHLAALDRESWGRIVSLYVHDLNRPDLALLLAPDDYRWLLTVRAAAAGTPVALEAKRRAVAILKAACTGPDASPYDLEQLADLCMEEGDDANGVDYLQRALALRYDAVPWRLARAEALLRLGRREEARAEAETCLRLQPDLQPARDLLQKAAGR